MLCKLLAWNQLFLWACWIGRASSLTPFSRSVQCRKPVLIERHRIFTGLTWLTEVGNSWVLHLASVLMMNAVIGTWFWWRCQWTSWRDRIRFLDMLDMLYLGATCRIARFWSDKSSAFTLEFAWLPVTDMLWVATDEFNKSWSSDAFWSSK